MAEALPEESPTPAKQEKENTSTIECAVCLQTCIHPAKLLCGHIFCFLCIKGMANRSNACALCRQEIPPWFLEHPNLVSDSAVNEDGCLDDGYQWYYEGRNGGWWQYDQRTSRELEASYKAGENICELLIAGYLYVANFESMLQMRVTDTCINRRIKRDLANIPKKGVAGIRALGSCNDDSGPSDTADRVVDEVLEAIDLLRIEENIDESSL